MALFTALFVQWLVKDLLFYIFPCGNSGRSKEGVQAEKYKLLSSMPTMDENSRNLLEMFKVLSYAAGTCAWCIVCPSQMFFYLRKQTFEEFYALWRKACNVSHRFRTPQTVSGSQGQQSESQEGRACARLCPSLSSPPARLIPISSVIGMQPQSGGGRGIFGKKRQSSWELYSD